MSEPQLALVSEIDPPLMRFESALAGLRGGHKVRRRAWEAGRYLVMAGGNLVLDVVDDNGVAWYPSQKQILSLDWELA